MLEQMNLTVFIIAVALGAVSERHVRICKIGLAADGTFMSCHLLCLSACLESRLLISCILALSVASVEFVMTLYLLGRYRYSLDIRDIEDQTVDNGRKNGKSGIRSSNDEQISHRSHRRYRAISS